MNYLKFSIGIFIVLSASRFLPHPPNYTAVIALSFYIPAFLGRKYIPLIMFSFLFTDFFIGFHKLTFFTWGSVLLIGLFSVHFKKKLIMRFLGAVLAAVVFFIVTNLGVWLSGQYGYSLQGFVKCYFLALPFFNNTLTSTLITASIIEAFLLCFSTLKFYLVKKNSLHKRS